MKVVNIEKVKEAIKAQKWTKSSYVYAMDHIELYRCWDSYKLAELKEMFFNKIADYNNFRKIESFTTFRSEGFVTEVIEETKTEENMRTLNSEDTKAFLALNPTLLCEFKNVIGQLVKLYEHPVLGEDAPIYAHICNSLANTFTYDVDTLLIEDYQPILSINDEIVSNYSNI